MRRESHVKCLLLTKYEWTLNFPLCHIAGGAAPRPPFLPVRVRFPSIMLLVPLCWAKVKREIQDEKFLHCPQDAER